MALADPAPPVVAASNESLHNYQEDLDAAVNDLDSSSAYCMRCADAFQFNEKVVQAKEQTYHVKCFVIISCSQCFQPFPDGVYYEFDGRKYCEHDFHVLFAPCCSKCGCFISGRVIKAVNSNWHPDCFRCQSCDNCLADEGFVKLHGR
ncbi:hypothetical protein P879_05000 [Paragonimus westermani]|uniref:LIM zinc-binding domain-containing protein n=1 Tax=Paragonimus westermani TaxID=34504 RepID=A0A8T0DCC4_9TREM|nr:hypothetical protein P879_05000 [Paragonimus westermani]